MSQGLALGLAALCASSPSHAAEYEQVVVTATRTPVALADSLASVSTLSREQLDARQPVTLADARASIELITAMYDSARRGVDVAVPLSPDHPLYRSWLP